jgi:hypothetical protein
MQNVYSHFFSVCVSDKSIHAERTIRTQCGQGNLAEKHGISAVGQVNSISSDASYYSLRPLHLANCVEKILAGKPGLCSLTSAARAIYTRQGKCFKLGRIPRRSRNWFLGHLMDHRYLKLLCLCSMSS